MKHGAKDQAVHNCAETRDGRFILSVANGGAAIPAAARANLFQPSFRSDRRPSQLGLGLGLHVASQIAKAHGGELTLSSDDAETRLTFVMPLIEQGVPPS